MIVCSQCCFSYAGEVLSTGQNLSGGSSAGNDAGNDQSSSLPVDRVGENSLTMSRAKPESEGQKVCFCVQCRILMGVIWRFPCTNAYNDNSP